MEDDRTMINIYDGNNYYRVMLETDFTGFAPRAIMTAMQASDEVNIWCWDGEKGNSLRRQIYDGYKRNRTPLKKDIYAGFELIKEVLTHTSAIQVEVPGYEADDVVATLSRGFAKRNEQVAIYSNDYDFAQLSAEFPANIFVGARSKVSVPPKLIRHYKAMVGDPSDNIPGIAGFGEKAWNSLGEERIEKLMIDLFNDDKFDPDGLTPRVVNWLGSRENREAVVKYWDIVGFYDVPEAKLEDGMTIGINNPAKAEAILERFML